MPSENKIWADVLGIVSSALSAAGITGWTVSRAYQPTQGKLEPPYLLLHKLAFYPAGWQGVKYSRINGTLKGTYSQLTEYDFQIDAVKRRTADATETTSEDILRAVSMWLMSDEGIAAVQAKGYFIARITEVRNPEFETADDVFEFSPNIKIKICAEQTLESSVPEFEGTESETKMI